MEHWYGDEDEKLKSYAVFDTKYLDIIARKLTYNEARKMAKKLSYEAKAPTRYIVKADR